MTGVAYGEPLLDVEPARVASGVSWQPVPASVGTAVRDLARGLGTTPGALVVVAVLVLTARLAGEDHGCVQVVAPVGSGTRSGWFLAAVPTDVSYRELVTRLAAVQPLPDRPSGTPAAVICGAATDRGAALPHDHVVLLEWDGCTAVGHPTGSGRDTASARFVSRLGALLGAAVRQPDSPVWLLEILSPAERAKLLHCGTGAPAAPSGTRLGELIREQSRRTPGAIAVSDETGALTYRQLVDRADAVAGRLRDLGVGPDAVVAVCASRSCQLVEAIVGVLLADGAYLPIDLDAPAERLRHMLGQTRPVVVLADEGGMAGLRQAGVTPVCRLDATGGPPAGRSGPPPRPPGDGDLAYVIYTSGSTGWPKGVAVTHRAVVNRLRWMQEQYRLRYDDVVLQKTPYTFDVSVWEFFWPLLAGARTVLSKPDGHRDPEYLADLVRRRSVTTLHFVPSALDYFCTEMQSGPCPSLRRVIVSGEALSSAQANRFTSLSGAELHNLYGPTEAAIDVTHWPCRRPEPGAGVPIGYPIRGVRAYVLDRAGGLAPVGVPGELHLGGVCLARGYLADDDLTERYFRMDPFSEEPDARMYRTGDLVRWVPEGYLEFLGRLDNQVKLRGFRIELGEVEAALLDSPAVAGAVVLVRDDMGPSRRLVAYVVPRDRTPAHGELRDHLARRLPDYMIPSTFMALSALPRTSSGKCDRRALPRPPGNPGRSTVEGPVA